MASIILLLAFALPSTITASFPGITSPVPPVGITLTPRILEVTTCLFESGLLKTGRTRISIAVRVEMYNGSDIQVVFPKERNIWVSGLYAGPDADDIYANKLNTVCELVGTPAFKLEINEWPNERLVLLKPGERVTLEQRTFFYLAKNSYKRLSAEKTWIQFSIDSDQYSVDYLGVYAKLRELGMDWYNFGKLDVIPFALPSTINAESCKD